ncbi:MAG: hypothetical protein ACFB4J_00690 [Elainellaceae cyanobacterium]
MQQLISGPKIQRVGIVALISLATLLPACEGGVRGLFNRQGSQRVTGLTEEEAQQYLGERVTVRGIVQGMVGPAAFIMQEESLFTSPELLVINAARSPVELPDESEIDLQVTGVLQRLSVEEIQQTYGTQLDPRLSEYEGKPVIIADAIAVQNEPL